MRRLDRRAQDAAPDTRLLHSTVMAGDDLHSFIVRIWLEESTTEAPQPSWRGSITHVLSGRRQFFVDLNMLPNLIRPYLEALVAESHLPEGE